MLIFIIKYSMKKIREYLVVGIRVVQMILVLPYVILNDIIKIIDWYGIL